MILNIGLERILNIDLERTSNIGLERILNIGLEGILNIGLTLFTQRRIQNPVEHLREDGAFGEND